MRTMRTLGTLVVIGGTVLLAYGCSAAGNAPIGTDDAADGSTPTSNYGGGGSDASAGSTTPKKDAGTTGGGYVYDAGSVVIAPEGSACDLATATTDTAQNTESCGLCGTQNRACLSPDGGSTGAVWAAWSPCTGETTGANACDPTKTYTATACGNCGTMPAVCDPTTCTFGSFDCTEPSGACHPTDTEFILGASCSTAGQGRVYTCGATCTYGSPGACQAPPPNPNTLTFSATGVTVSGIFSLPASPQLPSMDTNFDDSCPISVDTTDLTSGAYVAIVNSTASTIHVSVWDGPAVSTNYDTVMAWYNTPLFPPPDLTACGFANDDCGSASATCLNTGSFTYWSSLSGTEGPSIPAGGTITVFVSMLSSTAHGNVKLYAKD